MTLALRPDSGEGCRSSYPTPAASNADVGTTERSDAMDIRNPVLGLKVAIGVEARRVRVTGTRCWAGDGIVVCRHNPQPSRCSSFSFSSSFAAAFVFARVMSSVLL